MRVKNCKIRSIPINVNIITSTQITVTNPGNDEHRAKGNDIGKPKSNDDTTNNKLNNNKDKRCGDSKKKEEPTPSKMNNNNNDESKFYSPPPTIKDMKIPRPLQLTRSPSIDTPKRSLYHEFSALLSPVTTTNDVDASINQCALKLKNLDLSCR